VKKTSILILLFVIAISLTTQGCVQSVGYNSIEKSVPTITVKGTGSVEVVPDEAIVRFGVMSEEKSLQKAYQKNTDNMNAVIASVKNLGIEGGDIKSSSYSITPIYPRDEKGYQIPGKPATFRVSQQLTVKVRDISKIGALIDKVISSGTNTFGGIQFDSSKSEALQVEAKVKAAKDAKEKAKLLADSLGVKIGKVLRVDGLTVQPYDVVRKAAMSYDSRAMTAAPQIAAGTMEVTSSCNVIYEIVQ